MHIELPYEPRRAFMGFHNRTKRWACLVVHRRGGKTVAQVNDAIRCAIMSPGLNALYGIIGPYRVQMKAVAWDYLKYYSRPLVKNINESELTVELVNGAKIRIFGQDNAESLRGLGFNGVYLDEFGDFKPSVFGNIIRPALSDKGGYAVFSGTPKGRNQFYTIYETAEDDPSDWFLLRLPASESGILPSDELAAAQAQLTEDQYLQEYECSFDAAILGAFYGKEMREAEEGGRITEVPWDRNLPVHTAWDLGWRDDTSVWFFQVTHGEIRVIDFFSVSGLNIHDIASQVTSKPYQYGTHYLPHDARAVSLQTGKSTIEQLSEHLGVATIDLVPTLSVQDGIQAARLTLPICWFDAEKCADGIEALKQYQRAYDEANQIFSYNPLHNWCSHAADAFRMLAVAWRQPTSESVRKVEKPLIVGPGNTVTLNDMWAVHDRYTAKRARI